MKWILMVFMNLMVFSAFAQECSWDGMGENRREELKKIIIQKARERLEAFLIDRGIIRTSEDPMELEIVNGTDGGYKLYGVRIHYKFKTQRGSEISTDPMDQIGSNDKNDFKLIDFNLNVDRDVEGYPIKKICGYQFHRFNLNLFNLTLNNYWVGSLELFDFNDTFTFEIPISSNLE